MNNGDYINVIADAIDKQGEWICAWLGEDIVAIAKADIVDICRLADTNEEKK